MTLIYETLALSIFINNSNDRLQVDVGRFPPYGEYVPGEGGLTKKVFEGLLQNIEAHIYAYALVRGGTFSQRVLTTLANESFNGQLAELDYSGCGCPKATDIGRMFASVAEIQHYRHNPERYVYHWCLLKHCVMLISF